METQNTQATNQSFDTSAEKSPRWGAATVDKLIDEVEDGCKAYQRSRLASVLPPSEVLWDLVAAVAFTSGGLMTNGHPLITVIAAGAVPLALHVVRLLAGTFLGLEAVRVLHRFFQ